MILIKLWLLGSVIVALDVFYTLHDDPIAKYKYNQLDSMAKFFVSIQLGLLCFIGSWLVLGWRLGTYLYINFLRRRK